MRLRSLLLSCSPLVLLACGASYTEPLPGTQIECTYAAANFNAGQSKFTSLPSGLKIREVSEGTGATVAAGTTASFRYAGCLINGNKIDNNNPPGAPLTFKVGSGDVIPGVDQGVVGMKVGGTREVIIPPSLGYGYTTVLRVPANSTLIFTLVAESTN